MKLILLALFLTVAPLHAHNIDILANFKLDELCPEKEINQETGFTVRSRYMDFDQYLESLYNHNTNKIILMNDFATPSSLSKVPKKKLVLFIWEPDAVPSSYCDQFSQVYTYNDDLVDNVKYFKFHYPVLQPMLPNLTKFEEKKLCVLISYRSTPQRIKLIKFFETKPQKDFDYYGFKPIIETPRYKGKIPSHPVSQEKFSILKEYRFAICFENTPINGYVTEKIFACFASGCVPIYWGAPNIEKYIPKNCFIDYRDFQNEEQLYHCIKTMPKEVYQTYIDNIRKFLQSDKAYVFSSKHFSDLLLDINNYK